MHLYLLTACFLILSFFGCSARETVSTNQDSPSHNAAKKTAEKQKNIAPVDEKEKPHYEPSIDIPNSSVPTFYGPLLGRGGGSNAKAPYIHFEPNSYSFWQHNPTTYLLEGCTGDDCECEPGEEGCEGLPAFANILLDASNFVWCKGGPYALCYYSGPSDGSIDLSCELSQDGRFANCNCYEIAWGTYFVDINAILNHDIYEETVALCGADGNACSGSANINKAPVCAAINKNEFIPEAELVSTFSLDCVPTDGLGQTDCPSNLYAGCMTAPCQRTSTPGIVECSCPTFEGPYQVGSTLLNPEDECTLGNNLVWSAAYSPAGTTIPPLSPCIPDAPGGNGCPLYNNSMVLPEDTDCEAVCSAYACVNDNSIQPAFTCDASLCTAACNERDLIQGACEGLGDCSAAGLAAVAKLESDVGCSCCASQLCGCTPSPLTNDAVFGLNQKQRDLGVIPQCDVNNTLCGGPLSQ